MDLHDANENASPALHDDNSSPTQQEHLHDQRCIAAPWVGTQLRVVAVTGLVLSHAAPFTRVCYQMPSRSKKKNKTRGKVICLDNEASSYHHSRRLRRDQNGRFTAIWGQPSVDEEAEGEFLLPPALDFVEIQVWNQFPNGFDVFLGMATLSISSLYQQQQQQQEHLDSEAPAILQTPFMWIPLQASNEHNQHSSVAQMNLSVQLQVSFLSDARASCIRQQVAQRAKRKETNQQPQAPNVSIADPSFAFTKPFQAIDWSAVVTTSVRHIFFHVSLGTFFFS